MVPNLIGKEGEKVLRIKVVDEQDKHVLKASPFLRQLNLDATSTCLVLNP